MPGFPVDQRVNKSACDTDQAGYLGSIPGLGRSSGEGQSLGREDPLEKEMANHSSILAWDILQTEEPGGLQPMGLQKSITTEHACTRH